MKNKTIAKWLIWTMSISLGLAVLKADSGLVGTLIFLNWAFVIVAIVRLYKLHDRE